MGWKVSLWVLEPVFSTFPSGAPQMAAAASKSWDVGGTGSAPATLGAQRFDILTIGITNDESTGNALMARKAILVADTGIDGAFAVALALFDPDIDVVGLIASPGNVKAEQATRKFAEGIAARRVELKMARRLRCDSVTGREGHAPSSRLGGGPF